jgi:hypothetical protein
VRERKAVRAKIESIEADARANGWPAELLYNSNFRNHPRGLAALLDANDETVEVTADAITILKYRRDRARCPRFKFWCVHQILQQIQWPLAE